MNASQIKRLANLDADAQALLHPAIGAPALDQNTSAYLRGRSDTLELVRSYLSAAEKEAWQVQYAANIKLLRSRDLAG